jgi:hypothetical protein
MEQMNERIKELAEQAEVQIKAPGGTYWEFSKEKFAELLLADAFKIINTAMVDTDRLQVDEIIEDRLMDAASDVVDAYGIVNAIYEG